MDFESAEQRYRQLKTLRDRRELDAAEFRVEVAKLLLRDAKGSFWMIDPESGDWFRNQGEGWIPDDPHSGAVDGSGRPTPDGTRHLSRRMWAFAAILFALVVVSVAIVFAQWPAIGSNDVGPPATPTQTIQVRIASPADGSMVAVGQQLGIESMLVAQTGLQDVASVELQVGDERVEARSVGSRVQPGQTSLPLSLPWRPSEPGEYALTVAALSDTGQALGRASISLLVAEADDQAPPVPSCLLDATLLADVTIPDGTGFPPGARMAKVWQVRNNGTCAWDMGYELVHVTGDLLGATSPVEVPATAAGERANLEVIFVAPEQTGTYSSTWQLRSPQDETFGPRLDLAVEVEVQAEPSVPPAVPADLEATLAEDGESVRLTWKDVSDNEDGFRVYRDDIEASIGLVPADAELFIDRSVACGNAYKYGVASFNASGSSSLAEAPEVILPACAGVDQPPTLILTVVPTQVVASGTFTVVFQAMDDIAVRQVVVRGEDTGHQELDAGRTFPCSGTTCAGSWTVNWSQQASTTLTLTAVASDSTGQASELAEATIVILPAEQPGSGSGLRTRALLWRRILPRLRNVCVAFASIIGEERSPRIQALDQARAYLPS